MTTQAWLWSADGSSLALVLAAVEAYRHRHHRRDLDATGWMPWRGLQAFGIVALLAITPIALRMR